MTTTTVRLPLVAVGAVITVVALGLYVVVGQSAGSNGEWSHSGARIVADAGAGLLSASSVHLTGTLVDGGATDVYDVIEGPHSAVGRLTADGAPANVRVLDSDLYLQGREFFTTLAGPEAGAALGDSWVRASFDDPRLAALGPLRLSTLAGLLTTAGGDGSVARGPTSMSDGVTVGTLVTGDGTMTIALDGRAYPRSFTGTLTGESITARVDLTFSGYDTPLPEVTAPGTYLALPTAPSS